MRDPEIVLRRSATGWTARCRCGWESRAHDLASWAMRDGENHEAEGCA